MKHSIDTKSTMNNGNTKSRNSRNWAKSLKLDKIVQMLMNVRTKCYRQNKLEHQCSQLSNSLPVTTGSDQTNTHCYSSYLYIRKLPTVRFELCKSQPMNNSYSYTSLCWPKLSSQSYTSPILRWTGNSPIWGQITVPTMGSSTYESPHSWLSG